MCNSCRNAETSSAVARGAGNPYKLIWEMQGVFCVTLSKS